MPAVSLDERQGRESLQALRERPMNANSLDEFLLEQLRVRDREIFRLRMELAKVRPDLGELENMPCEEQVQ